MMVQIPIQKRLWHEASIHVSPPVNGLRTYSLVDRLDATQTQPCVVYDTRASGRVYDSLTAILLEDKGFQVSQGEDGALICSSHNARARAAAYDALAQCVAEQYSYVLERKWKRRSSEPQPVDFGICQGTIKEDKKWRKRRASDVQQFSRDNGLNEEAYYFTLLNYLKFRMHQVARGVYDSPLRKKPEIIVQMKDIEMRIQDTQNTIVNANLGLVHESFKKCNYGSVDEDDLQSDLWFALLRAMDKFDVSKGFRFSTYCMNALFRGAGRAATNGAKHRGRYLRMTDIYSGSVDKEMLREARACKEVRRSSEHLEELRAAIECNSAHLNPVEIRVIRARYPANKEEACTLDDLGREIGISKERVRQIQNAAIEKLKRVLVEQPLLCQN